MDIRELVVVLKVKDMVFEELNYVYNEKSRRFSCGYVKIQVAKKIQT